MNAVALLRPSLGRTLPSGPVAMKRIHVWKAYRNYAEWSWCNRRIADDDPKGPNGHTPMRRALAGATCLECVKAVRDAALWNLRDDGVVAYESAELLDRLRLKRARKK